MIQLIQNGMFCGKIATPPAITETERYAIRELRQYLNLMTGRKVAIYKKPEPVEDASIVVGGALPLYGEAREPFGDDAFRWYTKDGRLYIDGGVRGIIYGVYDLLESFGCRFFSPECETVPTYSELTVPDTDRRDAPVFEYRDFYYDACRNNPAANLKYRTNGSYPVPEKFGGSVRYAIFVHSFMKLLPYDTYYEEHPEWYAMIDGSRARGDRPAHKWQLCLSNPEIVPRLTEAVREVLRADPTAQIMSISQNDFGRGCECEACRAINEEEGSPAGLMLRTVNAIAEALEDEFPHVLFDTLAYIYTRPTPKITRPRHNVCVRLCAIECCNSHPMEVECEKQSEEPCRSFADDLRDWNKICQRLYVWDYNTCFWHYPKPHPNWATLAPNLRFLANTGVKGVFAQGNHSPGGGCDMDELRAYLLTKLLWNPYRDEEALVKEFTDAFYGDAAGCIREYIDLQCRIVRERNIHIGCYDMPDAAYLTPELLEEYEAILARAENAVRDDTIRRMRIRRILLGLRYVRIRCRIMNEGIHDAEEIRDFFAECRAHGIKKFEECCDLTSSIQGFAEGIWRGNWCTPV